MSASAELEASIAAAIDPWLQHMRWRKDYGSWRERRIWQERHQGETLRDIWTALEGRFQGLRVLDLGAGMGGLSVAMMLEIGPAGAQVQAMDYNPAYCVIARLRAGRYGLVMPIAVAAGEHLPYPDASFDLVVCMDVLEHVVDAAAVLGEMYRVLRPGGLVLTTVPNRHAFRDPHYHLPAINWLPRPIAEAIIVRAGRSKAQGPHHDRQEWSKLNTYSWSAFQDLAHSVGFLVRDQVYFRLTQGEVRQLAGWRRVLLNLLRRTGLQKPIYRIYRYGWQGTYQIMLAKPR